MCSPLFQLDHIKFFVLTLSVLEIRKIPFDECKNKWASTLWKGRQNIKPTNSITFELSRDSSLETVAVASFWGIFFEGELVGVNSGFGTSRELFRSRGLWVDEPFRGQNLSGKLFSAISEFALASGYQKIWSLPRKSALKSYTKNGFVILREVPDSMMNYGPNYLAVKSLSDS